MNRSMLTGIVGGIAVATAGGVAGFAFLGDSTAIDEDGSAVVIEEEAIAEGSAAAAAPAPAARAPAAPAPAARAPAPVAQAAPAPEPVAEEECWEEEVTAQVDPKDDHAIAGTAAGALIGGVVADKISDDNDLATAAGAAAGAFFGRRAQKRRQENNTVTTTEIRCAPAG